ncbi:MAG: sigma 54-interacting transcriptional regulator [Desulfobacteraceae bacterium]|jgi:transcriptional regulator with PAS, ATPase and Fis domain
MQYDIKQIIDLVIFRELLERFTKLTKMATAILDLQGNVILRGHWADICAKFHRAHPETSRLCQESDTILAKKVKSGSKYNIYRCKNGLMDVAVPIVINGVHIGNIFAGQFFLEAPDIEFFKKQAARYGFEAAPYLEALSRVPVLSEDEVLNTVKFFCQMAIVIGQLGIARMKLTEANRQLKRNFDAARKELGRTATFKFDNIVCQNKTLKTTVARAKKIANSPSTILLTGESGTGKEVFAQAIHNASAREGGPFIPINCGAIPKELIQSELFGYEAGAFTGADRKGRMGKFEIANGGTLFLDEIGDMPLKMQVNLLRVITDRSIVRIGGTRHIPVDVRLIAATNKNLLDEVEKGNFREDLYYRLNVVPFRLPPLRERPEDVIPIAEYHLLRISKRFGKQIDSIHPDAKKALAAYSWPGNIREVRNAIEQAVNMTHGSIILLKHLPEHIHNQETKPIPAENQKPFNLSALEKETIERALRHYDGNITRASKALSIGRNTLYDKMKKYDLK